MAECARLDESQHPRRTSYPVEVNLGVSGGGKTHRNLVDKGLQRIVYISPSWKLAREKQVISLASKRVISNAHF